MGLQPLEQTNSVMDRAKQSMNSDLSALKTANKQVPIIDSNSYASVQDTSPLRSKRYKGSSLQRQDKSRSDKKLNQVNSVSSMTSSNPLKEYSDPVEQNKILQKHLYEWLLPENRQNLTRYLIHLKQSRK